MLIKFSTRRIYCPTGLIDTENVNRELTHGLWRNDICADSMLPLEIPARGHNTSVSAKEIRAVYTDYFMNEGEVECNGTNVNSSQTSCTI